MSRPTLNLKIAVENLHCHDEGDGWGDAEPYLWPVFFKIDGDSFAVNTGVGLIGFPIIESRNGDHDNLGDTDVEEGEDVAVPPELGVWQTTLKPIPVNDPVIRELLGDDTLAGIAGVVVVVMEEDGWPNDLAVTAYEALVNAVQLSVAQIAAGFQHATSAPTKEEIEAAIATVKSTAAKMVKDAVKGEMSGWQLIWYGTFGNNDDTIGSEAWTFTSDDFAATPVVSVTRRWDEDEAGDGDWELSVTFTGVVPCPAEALVGMIRTLAGVESAARSHEKTLSAMRKFQAGGYRSLPGLQLWWRALQHTAPDVIRAAVRKPEVRAAVDRLLTVLPGVLAAPDRPLGADELRTFRTLCTQLAGESMVQRAFARRALAVLPQLEGKSWNEAVRLVAQVPPRGRGRDALRRRAHQPAVG